LDSGKLYQWKDRNILVVEDDESSSFLISEILKNTGANLFFSYNGKEASE